MSPDRRIAKAWVGGVLAVGILLDIWLYGDLGNPSTISQTILWLSRECFLVPMGFGWLCGHFFWPRPDNVPPASWFDYLLGAAVVVIWTICYTKGDPESDPIIRILSDHSLIPFGFGVMFGHAFTAQTNIKRRIS